MHDTHTLQPLPGIHADTDTVDPRYVVLVVVDPDSTSLLMTKRAGHMRHHAGEVCFPGGRIEDGESTLDAALREAREELALHPSHVRIDALSVPAAYAATTYTTGKTFRIHYALLDPTLDADAFLDALQPNPDEVARVMWVDPQHCTVTPDETDTGLYRIHDAQHDEAIVGATADVCLALWAQLSMPLH